MLFHLKTLCTCRRGKVWESSGPGNLRFSSKDLANHPDRRISSQGILGSMMEDSLIVSALWDELRDSNQSSDINEGKHLGHSIEFFSSCSITSIDASPASTVEDATGKEQGAEVTFQRKESGSQETVRTSLLVGADGGNSFVRKAVGIPTMGFEYGRTAVTTTVKLQDSTTSRRRNNTMQKTAFQRFFPSGPVALLPMWDKGQYANVVWSTTPEHAAELVAMSSDDFVRELNEALQEGPTNSAPLVKEEYSSKLPHIVQNIAYGVDMLARTVGEGLAMVRWNVDPFQIPPSVRTVMCPDGKRFAFPLSLRQARSYVKPHVALVGDAAHTIHPMAGQGLNLGLGDVACLARHIVNAQKCGMHAGDTSYFLDLYESDRQRAAMTTMGGIQFLHAAFGTEVSPATWARSVGVNLANSVTPLREKLAHVAAGDLENNAVS
jgi:ubiquinone biosynthesis monooxygenase Coq6